MSCNIDDCILATPKIPECWAQQIRFGIAPSPNANYLVKITKLSNGSSKEAQFTSDVILRTVTGSLTDFTSDTDWFSEYAGKYKVEFYTPDTERTPATFEDGNTTTATCVLIEFENIESATTQIIHLEYATA